MSSSFLPCQHGGHLYALVHTRSPVGRSLSLASFHAFGSSHAFWPADHNITAFLLPANHMMAVQLEPILPASALVDSFPVLSSTYSTPILATSPSLPVPDSTGRISIRPPHLSSHSSAAIRASSATSSANYPSTRPDYASRHPDKVALLTALVGELFTTHMKPICTAPVLR